MSFSFLKNLDFKAVKSNFCKDHLRFVLVAGMGGLLFALYKLLVLSPVGKQSNEVFLIVPVLFAIIGTKIRVDEFSKSFQILFRTMASVLAIYLLFAYPTMLTQDQPEYVAFLMEYGRLFAVVAGLIGCFFLTWGLIPFTFLVWYKATQGDFLGLNLSHTDYFPLFEIGIFLVFLGVSFKALQKVFPEKDEEKSDDPKRLSVMERVVLVSIAVHMANYFYSAMRKVTIGETPFAWIFENQTQYLLLTSKELGQLPIGFNDAFTNLVYIILDFTVLPTNAILFFGQLFALIALCRIRWGIWTTLFYDLTHIVIFFVSGIFFYKWIILNVSVVWALNTMKEKTVDHFLKFVLISTVICAPLIFVVAKLGWWDTTALNVERFYAVTSDNQRVAIPTNYWGGFSIRLAQQRAIWEKENGFLPTLTYGAVFEYDQMLEALKCDYNLKVQGKDAIDKAFSGSGQRIESFVQEYHQWVLSHAEGRKNWLYNLYPHHIFSFPWEFSAFRKTDINDITGYDYGVTSVCLGHENGEFTRKVLKEKFHRIPIKQ